jgi:hypothetical protein
MCWVYIKRKLKFFKFKNNHTDINHDMIEDSDCSYNLMRDNNIMNDNNLYMRKTCHIKNQDILDSLTNDNINILTYKNLHMSEYDLNDNNVKNNNVKNNNGKNNNGKNNNVKNNKSKMYNINIDYPCNYNKYEWNNFKIDYI